MKLINKISRFFLYSSIVIFIIVSTGLYFVIGTAISDETDEQLVNISRKVVHEIRNGKAVSFPPFVEIISVDQSSKKNEFKDVLIKSIEEDEGEPFRQLTSFVKMDGRNYKIITRISLIEKEEMLFSIITVTLAAVFFLVLILYFTNKTVSKKILKDFYDTLKKLENFSLKNDDGLNLTKSKIEEFEQLNKSLLFLSERAKREYQSLKEFSEETNHELQTPIAVVKSKLELLLQCSDLSEDNFSALAVSLKSLNKLERINKSILLLNKLEHTDLFEKTEINISEEIKNIVTDYNDFITSRNITINVLLGDGILVKANQSLINILFGNLISNAIKHNIQNGTINIELKEDKLFISNTGLKPKGKTDKFFERFYKESDSSEAVGLGLTIVKKICDLYKIGISYQFIYELHTLALNFNKKKDTK